MAGTSYALVEVSGVVAAVDSLDAMCKAADVSFVTWERKLGGRLVTIIVEGNVAACKAAEEACIGICAANGHKLAAHGVIAAPSDGIREIVELSASKPKRGQGARRPDVMDLMMPEAEPEVEVSALAETEADDEPETTEVINEPESAPVQRAADEPKVSSSSKKQLTSNSKNGKQGLGKTDLRK